MDILFYLVFSGNSSQLTFDPFCEVTSAHPIMTFQSPFGFNCCLFIHPYHLPNWQTSKRRFVFSCPVVSNSSWSHGRQHTRPPCPSPSAKVCPSLCPLHQWCHPAISSSDTLFSFCSRSFPASRAFPMSQLFASGDQNIGASASASVLPMNIQAWFPLRLTGLISSLSKEVARVFPSTTVGRHQFFGPLSSLQSSSHHCAWPLERP